MRPLAAVPILALLVGGCAAKPLVVAECPPPPTILLQPAPPLPQLSFPLTERQLVEQSIRDAGQYKTLATDHDALIIWGQSHCKWAK